MAQLNGPIRETFLSEDKVGRLVVFFLPITLNFVRMKDVVAIIVVILLYCVVPSVSFHSQTIPFSASSSTQKNHSDRDDNVESIRYSSVTPHRQKTNRWYELKSLDSSSEPLSFSFCIVLYCIVLYCIVGPPTDWQCIVFCFRSSGCTFLIAIRIDHKKI
jgi:hypothetical protein